MDGGDLSGGGAGAVQVRVVGAAEAACRADQVPGYAPPEVVQLRPAAVASRVVLPSPAEADETVEMSGDVFEQYDELCFGGMHAAGSYYASLAQGMLVEPPAAGASSDDGEHSAVETPLWSYLLD